MQSSRDAITAGRNTISNDGGQVRDPGVVRDARESIILDIGQGHYQSVILQEADRCVSHNCSDAKHLLDAIPPCLTPSSTSACTDQDAKLPSCPRFHQKRAVRVER